MSPKEKICWFFVELRKKGAWSEFFIFLGKLNNQNNSAPINEISRFHWALMFDKCQKREFPKILKESSATTWKCLNICIIFFLSRHEPFYLKVEIKTKKTHFVEIKFSKIALTWNNFLFFSIRYLIHATHSECQSEKI